MNYFIHYYLVVLWRGVFIPFEFAEEEINPPKITFRIIYLFMFMFIYFLIPNITDENWLFFLHFL
jgi:hypothetical protein